MSKMLVELVETRHFALQVLISTGSINALRKSWSIVAYNIRLIVLISQNDSRYPSILSRPFPWNNEILELFVVFRK